MDPRDADLALKTHVELVRYALPFGAGREWPAVRERAEAVTGSARGPLLAADAEVIDMAVSGADLWPALLVDDPARPLKHWWWHLGAIHDRTYPADLLPEPLRSVYRDALSTASRVRSMGGHA